MGPETSARDGPLSALNSGYLHEIAAKLRRMRRRSCRVKTNSDEAILFHAKSVSCQAAGPAWGPLADKRKR